MKALKLMGSSLDDFKLFPLKAKRAIGFELDAVQRGLEPSDWKPMNIIGSGAYEIRIHVRGEWRVIYVTKYREAVYLLHAFQKKTQKTRKEDLDIARHRYQQLGEK